MSLLPLSNPNESDMPSSGPVATSSGSLNLRQLRQRRVRIVKDKAREGRENEEIRILVKKAQSQTSQAFHIFTLVLTAVIVSVGAGVEYFHPGFFRKIILGKGGNIPTFYLATQYPPEVIVERDLPRFFRTYSIATHDNEFAQDAVRKVQRSRTQLKRRAGIITTVLRAWDDSNVMGLLRRGICGPDWESAYHDGSQMRKNDLLMWCLLASRITEGFFQESVEFLDSPLFLLRKRGMVVQKSEPSSSSSGVEESPLSGALSNLYYLHPRTNTTAVEWIPAKALAWLISNSEENLGGALEARRMLEHLLYDLTIQQGNEDDFVVMEEVCQHDRPERAIAMDCPKEETATCCYFVLPKKYGGKLLPPEDEEDK